VFQTARILRDTGILRIVEEHPDGLTQEQVATELKLPAYGVRVLMEAALGIGLLVFRDGVYKITKTSTFILHDRLTQVNMDFTQDVCYNGMFYLEDAILNGKPEGLKVFGNWSTIYEGLSKLPEHVQKSWFGFDHFYSDYAFPEVLQHVFKSNPKRLLDIGGNTGKWSIQCAAFSPEVTVTIMDLPGQVGMAKTRIEEKGLADRINFYETNILDESQPFPKGFEAIWMSQFLDCFSEDEIRSILRRCRGALTDDGVVYILEPFWDRQRFEVSAFVLQQTSLYFTAMANGNSQMYHSGVFIRCVEDAGFDVTIEKDLIGVSHTLLTCRPKK